MHMRCFAYGLTAVVVLGADRLASGDCEVTELSSCAPERYVHPPGGHAESTDQRRYAERLKN